MSSITIISDAPNCGVTYDCHYGDHNSFIIQATGQCGQDDEEERSVEKSFIRTRLLLLMQLEMNKK